MGERRSDEKEAVVGIRFSQSGPLSSLSLAARSLTALTKRVVIERVHCAGNAQKLKKQRKENGKSTPSSLLPPFRRREREIVKGGDEHRLAPLSLFLTTPRRKE